MAADRTLEQRCPSPSSALPRPAPNTSRRKRGRAQGPTAAYRSQSPN